MSDTWFDPVEVHELTDRKRWSAQCRRLAEMGIPFRPNAAGRPLVERAAVLRKTSCKKKPFEPDWTDVNGQVA